MSAATGIGMRRTDGTEVTGRIDTGNDAATHVGRVTSDPALDTTLRSGLAPQILEGRGPGEPGGLAAGMAAGMAARIGGERVPAMPFGEGAQVTIVINQAPAAPAAVAEPSFADKLLALFNLAPAPAPAPAAGFMGGDQRALFPDLSSPAMGGGASQEYHRVGVPRGEIQPDPIVPQRPQLAPQPEPKPLV